MKPGDNLPTFFERWLVPAVFTGYAIWYLLDAHSYYISLREDGALEWATFVFLMAAGFLAGMVAYRMRRMGDRRFWFLLVFSAGSLLAGLEEISWGQRVFGLESTEFFLEHSDSQEMNAHNVLQNVLAIKTKHVAGLVLLFLRSWLTLVGPDLGSWRFLPPLGCGGSSSADDPVLGFGGSADARSTDR